MIITLPLIIELNTFDVLNPIISHNLKTNPSLFDLRMQQIKNAKCSDVEQIEQPNIN